MWEPQHLTTLWTSTACYRGTFTFTRPLQTIKGIVPQIGSLALHPNFISFDYSLEPRSTQSDLFKESLNKLDKSIKYMCIVLQLVISFIQSNFLCFWIKVNNISNNLINKRRQINKIDKSIKYMCIVLQFFCFFFIWFVRLLALRPLLAYCASLGW
jgi:uncharacterized protein YqhQ